MRFRLLQAREAGDPVIAEERAAFAARLGVDEGQIVPFDCLAPGLSLARVTEGVDVVLVGGSGAFGMQDRHTTAWLRRFNDVLGELVDRGFPTFASCFGYQGIVVALGGEVMPDEAASEVGTYTLFKTPEAAADPVFDTLPAQFQAQLGHKDRAVRMPSALPNALRSERCPYQAFRVPGKPIYATQFHPELSGDDNRKRFSRYYDLYSKAFGKAEAERMMREGFQPSPESNTLLATFVRKLQEGALS